MAMLSFTSAGFNVNTLIYYILIVPHQDYISRYKLG